MEIDTNKLQEGLVTAPLATICAVLLVAVWYLFRELRAEQTKRIEQLERGNAQTLETLTSAITLGLKVTEAVEVLDKAVDRFTKE